MSAVTVYDLAGLRSLREVEQRSWEMTPDAHLWPKTSPWAEDWDNYIADATARGLSLFVQLSCFDFDEDIDDVLRGLKTHGTYLVGNVDGDGIVGFSDERDRQTLLEWCHSTTARQSPT